MKKKDWVEETFHKTMDDRYAEMTKSEKVGYWLFIGFVCSLILYGFLS